MYTKSDTKEKVYVSLVVFQSGAEQEGSLYKSTIKGNNIAKVAHSVI